MRNFCGSCTHWRPLVGLALGHCLISGGEARKDGIIIRSNCTLGGEERPCHRPKEPWKPLPSLNRRMSYKVAQSGQGQA